MKNILGCVFLFGFCLNAGAQLTIDTVAGGVIRSGVPAQEVLLTSAGGMAVDSQGNIVFAETSRHVIRRIRPDGIIETIAGTGVSGYGGDGGPALSASLWYPKFLQFDATGNLYFADSGNYRIRRIDTSGTITTVVGTGIGLMSDDDSSSPRLGQVQGMALDRNGVIYFSESTFSTPTLITRQQIRRCDPAGKLELVAGTGTRDISDAGIPASEANIQFSGGFGDMTFDGAGNLYLALEQNIVRISSEGVMYRFAGSWHGAFNQNTADGPARSISFESAAGLSADASGNVYFADGLLLRRVGTDGNVTTLAGARRAADDSPDGPALNAVLNSVSPLTTDGHGNVYIFDSGRIREVTSASELTTLSGALPKPAPDGTPALSAWFLNPEIPLSLLAVGPDGAIYMIEESACLVRKITTAGLLATVAGTGRCAVSPSSGAALSTDLSTPLSIAVDANGTVYVGTTAALLVIVSGQISVVTGFFANITALAADSKGRVYVNDANTRSLTRYSAAAGIEDLTSWLSPFQTYVAGLGIDSNDNLYVAGKRDFFLSTQPIIRFSPSGAGTLLSALFEPLNPVHSIAVSGTSIWYGTGNLQNASGRNLAQHEGYSGDGGPLASAGIGLVGSVATSTHGDLFLFDSSSNRIRKVTGAPPAQKPVIRGIVNAASARVGPIAPGEIISIYGSNLGPDSLRVPVEVNNSIATTLGNVYVTFDNRSVGAITAAISGQINVLVPYSIALLTSTTVTVVVDGIASDPVTAQVGTSAFALVAADGSGSGQGAILNQDGSLNASSPAPRGTIVTLYGTGEGMITPALPTGAFSVSAPFSTSVSPISVTIGGQTAEVLYAGEAPFQPAGVFQINVRVPQSISSGNALVVVNVGSTASAGNITVSVN